MKQLFAGLSLVALLASCQHKQPSSDSALLDPSEIITISGTYCNLVEVASFIECDSAKMIFFGGPLADSIAKQYLINFDAGTDVSLSVTGYFDTSATFIITQIVHLGQEKLCNSVAIPHRIYFGTRHIEAQGDIETSLLLKENGEAVLITDFLDGEDVLVERGNWSVLANQKIELRLIQEPGLEVGTLSFALREDSIHYLGDDFMNEGFSLLAYSQPFTDTIMSTVIMAIEAIRLDSGLPLFLYFSENTKLKEVFDAPSQYAKLDAWLSTQGCIDPRKNLNFVRVIDVVNYLKGCEITKNTINA